MLAGDQRPTILPVRLPDISQIIRYVISHEAIIPSDDPRA